MRKESTRIHTQLDAQRCNSRIAAVERVVDSFRFSLPHPHNFSPSTADMCWIPEVQKAIIDGTDEEFQDCEADLRSRMPEISAVWLEERRRFFLQLLPQDSPNMEHLSLATTLFNCVKCDGFGMHIEDALSHYCRTCIYGSEYKANFSSVASANAFHGTPWDSRFAEYEYSAKLSAIARTVVVQCGENPDTITTREMNRKHHRFACFARDGTITVLNWLQVVSSGADLSDYSVSHLCHATSLSTSITTEVHRVDSWNLTNCRDIHLSRRTGGAFGVASTVGEERDPKATNWATNSSPLSKITLVVRESLLTCNNTVSRTPSDVSVSQGTKLRTQQKITTTEARMMLPQ